MCPQYRSYLPNSILFLLQQVRGRHRRKLHEHASRVPHGPKIFLRWDAWEVLLFLREDALYRAVLVDVLQRSARANVPYARGEVGPEEERKVNEGARVEAERRPHLGVRDEQEGLVSARDVTEEWRSVDEHVLHRVGGR
jgi:hypothetical protein